MKLFQFIGTRKKADFLMYLAYSLTNLNKRVLIVDQTTNEWYKYGYTRITENEQLYDLQGIDILCGTQSWLEVEECLRRSGETTGRYDIIMFDVDHIDVLNQDWPDFDERFYIGDFERDHIMRDAEMLNFSIRETKNNVFRHVTFSSKYKMNPDFIEVFLEENIKWNSVHYLFEPDEATDEMRLIIQHQQTIPYKQLNKQYKELITWLVAELVTVHVDEVRGKNKTGILGSLFGKKQKMPEL